MYSRVSKLQDYISIILAHVIRNVHASCVHIFTKKNSHLFRRTRTETVAEKERKRFGWALCREMPVDMEWANVCLYNGCSIIITDDGVLLLDVHETKRSGDWSLSLLPGFMFDVHLKVSFSYRRGAFIVHTCAMYIFYTRTLHIMFCLHIDYRGLS